MQVYALFSMQNLGGCQVFAPRSLNQRRFSGCPSDAYNSFIIFLKPFSGPSAPPVNVSARNLSSTSILVQWGEVPDTDKNGIILSYTVNYQATPEGNPQQKQVVNASTREVTLTGLKKNTEYKIEVFANTSKGGGKKSEPPITVHTNEDSKYTIAQVAAAAFMGLATDAFIGLQFYPNFYWYRVYMEPSTDGKLRLALNIESLNRFTGRFPSESFRQRPVR